jgi:ornithine decarboxylase
VYGSLADAGALGFRYPVRCVRANGGAVSDRDIGFSFFGPTCDSADVMRGPFFLPANIAEGDWIEIGLLGAYGACLRTGFNGFDRARIAEIFDAPVERMDLNAARAA